MISCTYFTLFLHRCPVFKVRVDLIEEEHVCSAASKRKKYRQEVNIRAESTRSVPFVVIPMKEGHFKIEVKAAVKDSALNDGIIKILRVVVRATAISLLTYRETHILLGFNLDAYVDQPFQIEEKISTSEP